MLDIVDCFLFAVVRILNITMNYQYRGGGFTRQISEFGRHIFLKPKLKIPLLNLRSKFNSTLIRKISRKNNETLLFLTKSIV